MSHQPVAKYHACRANVGFLERKIMVRTLVFIRHKIAEYRQWKDAFDAFLENRHAGGERSYRIAHVAGDKNDLCLVFEWDTAANAKQFLDSPGLAAAMKRAGVVGKPQIVI